MSQSNDLFELIKSLTKSEKRYFKLTVSPQTGEKNYLRLFDAIDAQESYDEEALKAQFSGEAFIRQLHVTKNYLYRLILKSLRSFHDDASANVRISNLLHEADILYEKGLSTQHDRLLSKARSIAEESLKIERMLEILEMGRRTGSMHSSEDVEQFTGVRMKVLDRIRSMYMYDHLLHRISLTTVAKGVVRGAAERRRIEEIIRDPLMRKSYDELPLEVRRIYNHIESAYHYARLDFESALSPLRRELELLELHPKLLEEHVYEYSATLNNMLTAMGQLDRDEEFLELLGKLRRLIDAPPGGSLKARRIQARAFNSAAGVEFSFRMERAEFEICRRMIVEIEEGLQRFKGLIPEHEELRFYYLFAYVNLILGDYGSALRYINIALRYQWTPTRRQVFDSVRLMNLLIHYEIGNIELLEYQVRSTYRFLRQQTSPYKAEGAMLRFLRRMPGLKTPRDLTRAFKDLRAELVNLMDDPLERPLLHYFEYIAWLDSKIERKTFREVLEKKWKRRKG